jgi:hypothetical protein
MSYVVIVFLSIWVVSILGLAVALGFGLAQAGPTAPRSDGMTNSVPAPTASSTASSPQPSTSPASH